MRARIAFLGAGLMGAPMIRRLLGAGFGVSVWNRSREKAERLRDAGAAVSSAPAEAAAGADFTITMLSDGTAAADVVLTQGAAAAMRPGSVLIDMSSTQPAEARLMAQRLGERGIDFLDAPVSGGTAGAASGTLAIMVGGEAPVFDRARAMLSAMGRPVHVGPAGAGQLSKLANQAIVAITIGAVAEAMLLAERGGVDAAALRDALKGGFADSTILQQHGRRMSERDFAPGGRSRLQLKDLDNVLAEAETLGLTLPLVESIRDRFALLCGPMGRADSDHAALFLELEARNQTGR